MLVNVIEYWLFQTITNVLIEKNKKMHHSPKNARKMKKDYKIDRRKRKQTVK